jgi:holo-ACP synthase CitX
VVDAEATLVKNVAIGLEDGYSLGRLWDFDVYGPEGSKQDRAEIGKAARTCFVCGSPAAVCAGRRVHELAEVERRFHELLTLGICEFE